MALNARKKRRFVVNDENTVLVLTSFAKRGENRHSPIASHAGRVLTQLSKKQNVIVFAEKIGRERMSRENPRLMVHRVWKRRNPFSLVEVARYILKYNKASNILVQFDFDLLGGLVSTLTLLPVLLFAKLLGKRISFELHQTPDDITQLKHHHRIRSIYLKTLLNQYLRFFYLAIGALSDKIIVFEEELKERLSAYLKADKIVVLPVGVTPRTRIGRNAAKKRLHIPNKNFTILSFGYFDWHKGTDWLASVFADLRFRNLTLLLVGGKHPAHRNETQYKQFYNEIIKKSKTSRHRIKVIDYIPEDKLAPYFSAADLVILPYREFMAAPTALTHALSFRKPVMFSTNLAEYAKSPDFAKAQKEADLDETELFFPLHKPSFVTLLGYIRRHPALLKKLGKFAALLANKRSHRFVSRDYEVIISRRHIMRPRFAFNTR